jgi:hypothetical protein
MDTRLNKTIEQLEASKALLNTNTIRNSESLEWLAEAVEGMDNQVAALPQVDDVKRGISAYDNSSEETAKTGMRRIINAVKSLKSTLTAMIDMAARMDDSPSNAVHVKFKSDLTLKTVGDRLSRLEELFAPLLTHADVGGQMKVASAHEGSVILVLDLKSERASEMMGSTITSAMHMRDETAAAKTQVDEITQLKLKPDTVTDIQLAMDSKLENELDKQTKKIYLKYHRKSKDAEQLPKIKTAIRALSKELNRIQDIAPSGRASDKVRACFPT